MYEIGEITGFEMRKKVGFFRAWKAYAVRVADHSKEPCSDPDCDATKRLVTDEQPIATGISERRVLDKALKRVFREEFAREQECGEREARG